jgi:multimeric flavodoxin WrbA
MKITIINGNPSDGEQDFEAYLQRLELLLQAEKHSITQFNLKNLKLHYCIGCFGCWVKSPGECIAQDDARQVRQAMIQSDFTLWAAPLRMGFPTELLKNMLDKSIPLIHPYFAVVNNEAHHQPRYEHYPRIGLLLAEEKSSDAEDLRLVTDILARTALNFKSRLEFTHLTRQPVEELAGLICNPNPSKVLFEKKLGPTPGARITPPAHLTVFNGSPRGLKSNTALLLSKFLEGYSRNGPRSFRVHQLNLRKDEAQFVEAFQKAECVLIGFPLYTDAMPATVKRFIEALEPFCEKENNPPLGFLVQSGFPEAAHSRHVERYLEKLARRLGSPYWGTIVKGAGEGIQVRPEQSTRKLFDTFADLGATFGETGVLDQELLSSLARPERYPAILGPVFKIFARLPIASFYLDQQLKENGVYEERFARPYAENE